MTHKISERPRFSKKTNISLDLSRIHGHGVLSTVHSFGSLIKTSFSFPPSPASWRSLGTFTRALPASISTLSRIFANCYFQDALHANPLFCWYFVHPDKDYRRFPHFSKYFLTFQRKRNDKQMFFQDQALVDYHVLPLGPSRVDTMRPLACR